MSQAMPLLAGLLGGRKLAPIPRPAVGHELTQSPQGPSIDELGDGVDEIVPSVDPERTT